MNLSTNAAVCTVIRTQPGGGTYDPGARLPDLSIDAETDAGLSRSIDDYNSFPASVFEIGGDAERGIEKPPASRGSDAIRGFCLTDRALGAPLRLQAEQPL